MIVNILKWVGITIGGFLAFTLLFGFVYGPVTLMVCEVWKPIFKYHKDCFNVWKE